jgi:uncharacterized RDD family membrane protein YckC
MNTKQEDNRMPTDTDGKQTQCPGCGYQPSSPEDPFYTAYNGKGECPQPHGLSVNSSEPATARFGSDMATVCAREFASTSIPDEYADASAMQGNAELISWQAPTLNQRFHAYLITSCLATIPAAIAHLLIVFSIAFLYGDKFVVVNSNMFFKSVAIDETAQAMMGLLSLAVSLGFAFYQFVVIPSESGATRGEQRRGIAIIDRDGNEAYGMRVFVRRFVGLLINMITFLPLLLPLFHPRKSTLPDLLSKSRPVIVTGPSSSGWGVVLLAFVLAAGSQGIANWHMHSLLTDKLEPERHGISRADAFEKMGAAMVASSEKYLEKDLGQMLELQKNEHGFYTDDAEELLMNYGNQVAGNRAPLYMAAALDGRISIELQEDSYRVRIAPAQRGKSMNRR